MKHSDSGTGAHRSRRNRRQPYAWLGAGAVTLGIGAALAGGSAVAYADTGAGPGAGKTSSASSESASTAADSSAAKKATAHSARSSAASSSGGNLSSRKVSAAAASNAPAAAAVDTEATETAMVTSSSTGHSARVRAAAADTTTSSDGGTSSTAAAAVPAADPSPNMTSWLPSEPIVAGVAVNLAQQQIADARVLLQQQTWGSGNIPAGIVAVIPEILLAQASLSLDTWENTITPAQSLYAQTSGVPFVHELAGVSLLGALLLPTLATTALNSAGLFLPLVSAFEGTSGITPVQNLVSTAALNGRVYALVPVTMRATTEPIVYISINGGQSTPVLVDTGSSGLVVTMASVGDAGPLTATGKAGTSGYSGGLTYSYTNYSTTVNFGNGIVANQASVNIVDADDAAAALAFFHQLGGASGVLGIGANAAGPGPTGTVIPTTALPGELSDGVFLYQGLFLGIAGVMVFGPNPLPTRTSVSGAPDAYLNVKVNNGTPTQIATIIDSGGVYGTILSSQIGGGNTVPVGTRISVYTPDGVLLYSYIVTSQNRPTVIASGLINTGYAPFQHGPVYINYTAPDGIGSTDFDYA
ncbi:PecA family PE domain-processing aspartic protease [Mycolicibacterium sphagni]|uniref:PE cleavage protein A C-terminal domain-containing protein n=1 Tax=Mycolicibacterium sphagni TaxID=1786 RepID=A0ABX2JW99_9MYCO|nr:PecA family PE domain-processing aspartic protease [Mycolicibacterium sphagni]NTY59735.1 hypothetical protein [Mycolicibacterium sphagni]